VARRVGVIADTHCPEFVDALPDSILKAFEGVDLILHAGDVNERSTLDRLGEIAPVEAVRGDHDAALADLPPARELAIEGRNVVLVHGHRSRWIEEPNTLLWTLSLGYYRPNRGLARSLARRFPGADLIVHGHTHRPAVEKVGRTVVFSPGAVHQWSPVTARRRLAQGPGWFEWCWLQVARHLRRYEAPSVGIVELDERGIRTAIVPI
jgi:uncharacterized protein